MSNRPHKLPKATGPIDLLVGPGVESFTVGSWCPTVDGSGTPTCVAISIRIQGLGDVVVRIKSPQEVDRVVQMLLRHKRHVWPEAS